MRGYESTEPGSATSVVITELRIPMRGYEQDASKFIFIFNSQLRIPMRGYEPLFKGVEPEEIAKLRIPMRGYEILDIDKI